MGVAMDPPNLQLFVHSSCIFPPFPPFLIVLTQHTYGVCQPQRTRCATPSAPTSPAGSLAIRAAISRSFASQLKSGCFLGCGENACFWMWIPLGIVHVCILLCLSTIVFQGSSHLYESVLFCRSWVDGCCMDSYDISYVSP